MSPATAARRLALGLVLFAALSAHAEDAAPARALAVSPARPALLTTGVATALEDPAGSVVSAVGGSPLERAHGDGPSELRDLPRFETGAEHERDPSARLSVRGRNAGLLLGVSLQF